MVPVISQGTLASPGTSAMTFYVGFGVNAGTCYTNSIDGSTGVYGGLISSLIIEEYI
jgi:hypothetical protein